MTDSPKRPGRRPVEGLTDSQRKALRAVRDFMVRHNLPPTAQELADLLGMAPASAHELTTQLVHKGYLRREPRKARGLRMVHEPSDDPLELVSVPLLGTIAAGQPLLAEENVLGEVLVERGVVGKSRCFALRVAGDSMKRAAISNGDIVVVRQQPAAENGDIVVAMLEGEATVKRLSICEQNVELRPENPRYRPISVDPEANFRILGKVIAVRRAKGR